MKIISLILYKIYIYYINLTIYELIKIKNQLKKSASSFNSITDFFH